MSALPSEGDVKSESTKMALYEYMSRRSSNLGAVSMICVGVELGNS